MRFGGFTTDWHLCKEREWSIPFRPQKGDMFILEGLGSCVVEDLGYFYPDASLFDLFLCVSYDMSEEGMIKAIKEGWEVDGENYDGQMEADLEWLRKGCPKEEAK